MRYATVTTWAEYFEGEEGIKIVPNTILNRLRGSSVIGLTGRNAINQIFNNAFYTEDEVRSACADLLNPLPRADEFGCIEQNGIRHFTLSTFSKMIEGTTEATIRSKINGFTVRSIKGRAKGGQVSEFYAEEDCRLICSTFLSLPRANDLGLFKKDGNRFGSISALARLLSVSQSTISHSIRNNNIRPVKGRDQKGHKINFYSEAELRKALSMILQSLLWANSNGFLEKDGVRHGTINAWCKEFSISERPIKRRLQKAKVAPISGRAASGRRCDFYSESDVRTACADLLDQSNPQAA
jgi:hypothetical protein